MENLIIDLQEVDDFIHDPDFHAYLLLHTSDFAVAAWILQTLLDEVAKAGQTIDNTENI